jgi:hypothetical protein
VDIETVKKNREWKHTETGTLIAMPTMEEVNWLINEHDRLTTNVSRLERGLNRIIKTRCKMLEPCACCDADAEIAREALNGPEGVQDKPCPFCGVVKGHDTSFPHPRSQPE